MKKLFLILSVFLLIGGCTEADSDVAILNNNSNLYSVSKEDDKTDQDMFEKLLNLDKSLYILW